VTFLAAAVAVNYLTRLFRSVFPVFKSFVLRSAGTVKPIGRFGAAGGAINSRNVSISPAIAW
jgi:hypothetical protein